MCGCGVCQGDISAWMEGHPAAGDSKELWLGCSLGCSRHADLQSDKTVTGQSSMCDQRNESMGNL